MCRGLSSIHSQGSFIASWYLCSTRLVQSLLILQNDDDEVKLNVHTPKICLGLLHVLLIVMRVDEEIITVIEVKLKREVIINNHY